MSELWSRRGRLHERHATHRRRVVRLRLLTVAVRSSRLKRAATPYSSLRRLGLSGEFCLVLALLSVEMTSANASAITQSDHLKVYAHSRIIKDSEYQCFSELIYRESRWNVNASNSQHWGLGQMANKKYKTLDGYSQIDWSLRYIKDRYKTPCLALKHLKRYGWH
ncbi:hypothetical protein UFOVP1406_19 [uncultured Caudovirales phage]|uniref:Transglycosylase SLT domain-containing protein n=1 Tax=uncultured Caudovirales phage TaxID=2100421 RepID=A0A6J5S820_9CAUD|nr:hypothetical protein UFOVP1406_19 [uncultured Caudovirales phage]